MLCLLNCSTQDHYLSMKKLLTLLILVSISLTAQAQVPANDCASRVLICGDENLNNNSSGPGVDEFPGGTGCLVDGEHQSAWYEVRISAAGTLEFTLNPNAGAGEDYDFAVWGPNPICGGLGAPLRCSYADGNCGFCPQTGIGMGATDFSEPAPGQDGFVAPINANVGDRYYILIDNFNSSSAGFSLTWTGTAELGNVVVQAGPDREVCAPATVQLNGTQVGGTTPNIFWVADPPSALAFLSNPGILNPIANIPAGFEGEITYTLNVEQGACEGLDQIVINVADPVIEAITIFAFCESATGGLVTSVSGAPPPFTYQWATGQTSANLFNILPGDYTVTVTNVTGCSEEETFTVTGNNVPPSINAILSPAFCTSATGAIDMTPGAGIPPFQYEWSNGETTQDLQSLTPGLYIVTVRDSRGCTNERAFNILVNPLVLDPTASIQNSFCNQPNGSLQASSNNGLAPFTYLWSTGATTATIANLPVGTYTVTIRDSRGCTGVEPFSITTQQLPSLISPGAQNFCDLYVFPQVQVTNGSLNVVHYYTGVNGTGTEYDPGDTTTVGGMIYIYSNLGSNCVLQDSFLLTIRKKSSSLIDPTLCPGQSIVVNGTTYNTANPSGNQVLQWGNTVGCDSTIQVNLQFYPPAVSTLNRTLCPGQSLTVGSQTFNQSNLSGTVVLPNASFHGCDSTIQVTIQYYPPAVGTVVRTLCGGQSVTVGTQTFNQSNPNGTVVLAGAAQHGCDSTVTVSLTYTQTLNTFLNPVLCQGATFTVSGTTFGPGNQTGQVPLLSLFGCDSIVHVNLQYFPPALGVFTPKICANASITFQGQTFNAANPSGTVVLAGASAQGCDSTVAVTLSFIPPVSSFFSPKVCTDDVVTVGTSTFSAANPSGTVMFNSFQGCDSIVVVNLQFFPIASGTLNRTLCVGQSLTVGGQTFNGINPSGSVVLPNAALHGCDSTVLVSLSFVQTLNTFLTPTLCIGETFNVSGTVFTAANPSGNVMLSSVAGCDSVVHVTLGFYPPALGSVSPVRCSDQTFSVGGQVFSVANPSGNVILQNASSHGCDSTVAVAVTFIQPVASFQSPIICPGTSINIAGTVFNQSNPSGLINLNSAVTGCDSLVNVSVTFYPVAPGTFSASLCEDETLTIGNTVFTKNNPSGTVSLAGAGVHGCDSTLQVSLIFNPIVQTSLDYILCPGESVTVNGTTYTSANPVGQSILQSFTSCDSIVTVSVQYYPLATASILPVRCVGESFTLGGQTFTAANPSGVVVLSGVAQHGCDSIVTVSLSFTQPQNTFLTPTLCAGASFSAAGQTYNAANPMGNVTLQSQAGCDSIVHVSLAFYPPAVGSLVRELCTGQTLTIGGQTFNAATPTGSVTLAGAALHGCDSTFSVALSFVPVINTYFSPNLCPGETFTTAGQTFNALNPIGTIALIASGGCDSVVNVSVSYYPPAKGVLKVEKCPGQKFVYGNLQLSETTPNGSIMLENATVNGCDSLLEISVSYHYLTLELGPNQSLIQGDSFQFNPITNAEVASLTWTPTTYLSNPSILFPSSTPQRSIIYILKIVDSIGCAVEDRITLEVDEPNIYAPNIISPNGDGINDYFTLFAGKNINNIRLMRIYDRWGSQLFERENFSPNVDNLGWDGSFNGKKMNPAVYIWYAEIDLPGGKVILLKGDVTIKD